MTEFDHCMTSPSLTSIPEDSDRRISSLELRICKPSCLVALYLYPRSDTFASLAMLSSTRRSATQFNGYIQSTELA